MCYDIYHTDDLFAKQSVENRNRSKCKLLARNAMVIAELSTYQDPTKT